MMVLIQGWLLCESETRRAWAMPEVFPDTSLEVGMIGVPKDCGPTNGGSTATHCLADLSNAGTAKEKNKERWFEGLGIKSFLVNEMDLRPREAGKVSRNYQDYLWEGQSNDPKETKYYLGIYADNMVFTLQSNGGRWPDACPDFPSASKCFLEWVSDGTFRIVCPPEACSDNAEAAAGMAELLLQRFLFYKQIVSGLVAGSPQAKIAGVQLSGDMRAALIGRMKDFIMGLDKIIKGYNNDLPDDWKEVPDLPTIIRHGALNFACTHNLGMRTKIEMTSFAEFMVDPNYPAPGYFSATVAGYSHSLMRFSTGKDSSAFYDPFYRFDTQFEIFKIIKKAGFEFMFFSQIHPQDLHYSGVVERMPHPGYEGVTAMTSAQKARAMMFPDGELMLQQFYYALASGASKILFYDWNAFDNNVFDNAIDSRKERQKAMLQILIEAAHAKNFPNFIIRDSAGNPDIQLIRLDKNGIVMEKPDRTAHFTLVKFNKFVGEGRHSLAFLFRHDQGAMPGTDNFAGRTRIYTHPDVVNAKIDLNQSDLFPTAAYPVLYQWKPYAALGGGAILDRARVPVNEGLPTILLALPASTPNKPAQLKKLYHDDSISDTRHMKRLNERIAEVKKNMCAVHTGRASQTCSLIPSADRLNYLDDLNYYAHSNTLRKAYETLRYLDNMRLEQYKRRNPHPYDVAPTFWGRGGLAKVHGSIWIDKQGLDLDSDDVYCSGSLTKGGDPDSWYYLGDMGCPGGGRAAGEKRSSDDFYFLYKPWNFYFRYNLNTPSTTYAVHKTEQISEAPGSWLLKMNWMGHHWCSCDVVEFVDPPPYKNFGTNEADYFQ
jgi:hypothetical protein